MPEHGPTARRCTPQYATLTLAAGASTTVTVAYTSPSAARQTVAITLTASHTSATSHTVSASGYDYVTTAAGAISQITMTPADGSTYGSPTFSATVTWCDPDDAITTHTVTLGGVALSNTFVADTVSGCVSHGTSTWTNLTMQPWDQALVALAVDAAGHASRVSHLVRYTPSIEAYTPLVTPKSTSRLVVRNDTTSQKFIVTNERRDRRRQR